MGDIIHIPPIVQAELMMAENKALQAELTRLRGLIRDSDLALLDWMRCYAPEEFTKAQHEETRERMRGGTLAYIAHLRRDNTALIREAQR